MAKHLFDFEICNEQLPCASTSVNFSHEVNFIAKHQAVSKILNNQHFTYACDATSQQKTHFLEQHIYLSNGKQLSLGFSEIACDDSQTLLERCEALFKDLCEMYCLDPDFDRNVLPGIERQNKKNDLFTFG